MEVIFDKIYCISYLERMDRRNFMEFQFKILGLLNKVEFINAFDFSKILPKEVLNGVNKNVNEFPIFGCALSHYKCVKHAKLFGYKKILILEDDICFNKNFEIIYKYFNFLPKDWDYIKYMYKWNEKPLDNIILEKSVGYINLHTGILGDSNTNAGAYALNEKAIDLYLEIVENEKLNTSDYIKYFFTDFKNSPLNSYVPGAQVCLQSIYLSEDNLYTCDENIPYYGIPLFYINIDDFFHPETKFDSLLKKGR